MRSHCGCRVFIAVLRVVAIVSVTVARTNGAIVVHFHFPSGTSQGQPYNRRTENAYLPNNLQGRFLLEMFKVAFRRKVMFGLGIRLTLQTFAPTFNVHIKTRADGGRERHGFPDIDYFTRTMDELLGNKVLASDVF